MKKVSIKVITVLLAMAVLLGVSAGGASALNYSNNLELHSEAILLVSMDTGQTVFAKNADKKMYPASTTKIMTFIVAFENIKDVKNTSIEIKQSVLDALAETGSSMANLSKHVGEKVSVTDLFYSLMVPSGNDAAMVLADYVGEGNVQNFVDKMNAKAKEIGCENTHFTNPDGLHDDDHYTTARDLEKITKYALDMPDSDFKTISNTVEYKCQGDDEPLVTTNHLLDDRWEYYYTYAEGIKTGTTDEAGRCLVTTAAADGQQYMLVLLGAPYKEGVQEEYYNFIDAKALFRWCLVDLEKTSIANAKNVRYRVNVDDGDGKDSVFLVPEEDLISVVPKDMAPGSIVTKPVYPSEISAPVKTGDVVGTVGISYKDPDTGVEQFIATVNLVPEEDVASKSAKSSGGFKFDPIFFIIGGVAIAAIIMLAVGLSVIISKRRQNSENSGGGRYR